MSAHAYASIEAPCMLLHSVCDDTYDWLRQALSFEHFCRRRRASVAVGLLICGYTAVDGDSKVCCAKSLPCLSTMREVHALIVVFWIRSNAGSLYSYFKLAQYENQAQPGRSSAWIKLRTCWNAPDYTKNLFAPNQTKVIKACCI